jgi:hypothetical protein
MFPKIASVQTAPRRPLRLQPLLFPAFLLLPSPGLGSFWLILDKASFSFLFLLRYQSLALCFEREKQAAIVLRGSLNRPNWPTFCDSFMTLRRDYYKVKRFVIKLSFFFDLAPRTRCAKRISKFFFG